MFQKIAAFFKREQIDAEAIAAAIKPHIEAAVKAELARVKGDIAKIKAALPLKKR